MLNLNQQNLQVSLGTIVYRIITDPTFREQVIDNSETVINHLNIPLSELDKNQLLDQLKTFLVTQDKQAVKQAITPDEAAEGWWGG